jgi:spore coat protein U-like protein
LELVSVRNGGKEAKMKKISLIAGLMVWSLVFAGVSFAATASGSLQVMATVASVCSVSTTAVNFGAVTAGQSAYAASADGDITVTCPSGTAYQIALDAGQHSGGSGGLRYLAYTDGQQTTNGPHYMLTHDGGLEWGDSGYGDTYPYAPPLEDTGNGTGQPHTVTGYLDTIGLGIPAGTVMSDTVTVTIYY